MRLLILIALSFALGPLAAEKIIEPVYGFSAETPPAFSRWPNERGRWPNSLHTFYAGLANFTPDGRVIAGDDPDGVLILAFENIGQPLKQGEPINTNRIPHLPPGAQAHAEKMRWKDVEIDVITCRGLIRGVEIFMAAAAIPLVTQGILVAVLGVAHRENEIRTHLKYVVDRLDGKTTWTRAGGAFDTLIPVGISLAVVGLIVAGVIIMRSRQRPAGPTAYFVAPSMAAPAYYPPPNAAASYPQAAPQVGASPAFDPRQPQWPQQAPPASPLDDPSVREKMLANRAAAEAEAQRRQAEAKARRDAEMARIAQGEPPQAWLGAPQQPPAAPGVLPGAPHAQRPPAVFADEAGNLFCTACRGRVKPRQKTCMSCGTALR